MYLILGIITGILGVLPTLVRRRFATSAIVGAVFAGCAAFMYWLFAVSFAGPLFGPVWILTLAFMVLAFLVDAVMEDSRQYSRARQDDVPIWVGFLPVALLGVLGIGGWIMNSPVFRAHDYARLVGDVETRIWTQDVQPKDPAHMRMATRENAIFLAQKRIAEAGAIGSQFQVATENITLQLVDGELWYIAPLDFSGLSAWQVSEGIPGYIAVHGEDPHRQPEYRVLPQKMRYSPSAFFGDNLERHLRRNGYLRKGLTEFSLELDDDTKPWWVVTVYEPTIWMGGPQIRGVVVVDPFSGASVFHAVGSVPKWIDRVFPSSFVERFHDYAGHYGGGYLNYLWGKRSMTETEQSQLVYGTGDQPEWVTGITSTNVSDDSLIALVYTNTRTGKAVRYEMPGGATDTAVVSAVDKHPFTTIKKLHAADPQLYNVYGHAAAVVPLLSENHSFQGAAVVSIMDIQTVGMGTTPVEAVRDFERQLSERGAKEAVDNTQDYAVIDGVVDRVQVVVHAAGGSEVYLHVEGMPHIFTAGATMTPSLPLTRAGDRVRVEYAASGRDVIPMRTFVNHSLPLSSTEAQRDVRARSERNLQADEARSDARTVEQRRAPASPQALREQKRSTAPPP